MTIVAPVLTFMNYQQFAIGLQLISHLQFRAKVFLAWSRNRFFENYLKILLTIDPVL